MTSTLRTARALIAIAALALSSVVLFAGTSSAQTTACPAGGPGAAGGNAGTSVAGNGGLAFTVPGFGSSDTGGAFASGGDGGSARGGDGGRGGTGTLPICNQNINGGGFGGSGTSAAPVAGAPAAAGAARPGAVYGTGGALGLARTGVQTSAEIGLAGLALVLGGALLFAGQTAPREGFDTR
jgi:hypothetical protein